MTGSTFTEKTGTYNNHTYNYYEASLRISKNNTSLVNNFGTYTKGGTDYQQIYSRIYFTGENLKMWTYGDTSVFCECRDNTGYDFPSFMDPNAITHARLDQLWSPNASNLYFAVGDIYNEYAPVFFIVKFVDE